MEAIRKIFPDAQDSVTIDLPPSFRHRLIEVVVMPVDAAPLVRASQGTADVRAPLD